MTLRDRPVDTLVGGKWGPVNDHSGRGRWDRLISYHTTKGGKWGPVNEHGERWKGTGRYHTVQRRKGERNGQCP